MAGIISYYHGERGIIRSIHWSFSDGRLVRIIDIDENPFRRRIFDSGTDVRVDPNAQVGDKIEYLRMTSTDGIWVKDEITELPELNEAVERVQELETAFEAQQDDAKMRAEISRIDKLFGTDTRLLFDDDSEVEAAEPSIESKIFVSYSGWNTLMARKVASDLRRHVRVDTWLDLEEDAQDSSHDQVISKWLEDTIGSVQGFIVLLTDDALSSKWVRREIAWAEERAASTTDFRLIVVNAAEGPLPDEMFQSAKILNFDTLWYAHGLNEEVLAHMHGFQSRSEWLERASQALREDLRAYDTQGPITLSDLFLPSGIAKSFAWKPVGNEIEWELVIETTGGKTLRVASDDPLGELEAYVAVDFGIRAGDRVGGARMFEHEFGMSRYGVTVWMRTTPTDLNPSTVAIWMHGLKPESAAAFAAELQGDPPILLDRSPNGARHRSVCLRYLQRGYHWAPHGSGDEMGLELLLPFEELPPAVQREIQRPLSDTVQDDDIS